MTEAEACLWKNVLRAKGLKGYSFRRQSLVINFIVDFMCMELMPVKEVDGITQQFEETMQKDVREDKELHDAGFRVLRFTDDDVLEHSNDVHGIILLVVEEQEKVHPPSPRQRGT